MAVEEYVIHNPGPLHPWETQHGWCSRCDGKRPVRWNWYRQQWLCHACTVKFTKCWGKHAGQSTVHPCDAPIERSE